jgi:hypothetical protein
MTRATVNLNVNLQTDNLDSAISKIQRQRVRVGLLDSSKPASRARSKRAGLKKLKGSHYPARKIKGKSKSITLRKLAVLLDAKHGFISDARLLDSNEKLTAVMKELVKIIDDEPLNLKRLQNAAIALIRNPILTKQYGNNSTASKKTKGFNMPIVDTGALFSNITAAYSRG